MTPEDRPPSRDELLAMAYADGELAVHARREFEARLANDAGLRREVARQLEIAVLAREAAPPEPMDHEWNKIRAAPAYKFGIGLAWFLILFSSAGLLGWGEVELLQSNLDLPVKVLATLFLCGLILLFVLTWRARQATQHLDPYREVHR